MIRVHFMIIFLLFLSGCSLKTAVPKPPSPMTAKYLMQNMEQVYSETLKQTKVQTLPFHEHTYTDTNETITSVLVADYYDQESDYAAKHQSRIAYYLWITYTADHWGEFKTALPLQGTSLDVITHRSSIRSGIYFQEFSINFEREQLEQSRDEGLNLVLFGEKSTIVVNLPPLYLQTFLTHIDQIGIK